MLNKLYTLITSVQNNPKVFWTFCATFLFNVKIPKLITISSEELKISLQNGKSLIRVGDGEVMICMGRSIHYQNYNHHLHNDIQFIIDSYTENSPYILAVPYFAIQYNVSELKNKKRYRIWRLFRAFYKTKFNHTVPYADAVMFYHQNSFTDTLFNHLQNKNIVVVTKKENVTSELETVLRTISSSIHYIYIPNANTYGKLSDILLEIDQVLGSCLPEKSVILLAAGPAAKSIALHYAKAGTQALDIGHGIEIIGSQNDYSDRL